MSDHFYPLKSSAIYEVQKVFFAEISVFLSETDADASIKLTRASTHWLRHMQIRIQDIVHLAHKS